jgi:hypothetical protein
MYMTMLSHESHIFAEFTADGRNKWSNSNVPACNSLFRLPIDVSTVTYVT